MAALPTRRGLLVAVSVTVSFAAACGIVMPYFWTQARAYGKLDIRFAGDPLIVADPDLGFRPPPDGASFRRHLSTGLAFHIFSSRRGARVRRAGEPDPPRAEIVAVGCSFTWGHGLEAEETYPELLEDRLGAPVVNMAFGSYGTVQSLITLRRSSDLHPRLVVYGFIDDHMRRNLSPCADNYVPPCLGMSYVDFDTQNRPYLHAPDLSGFAETAAFFAEFFGRPGMSWRKLWLVARGDWQRATQRSRTTREGDPEAQSRALIYLIGRMFAETHRIGAKLLVVRIPYLGPGDATTTPSALLAAVEGLPPAESHLLELGPVVIAHHAAHGATLTLHPADHHPNRLANRLIADGIMESLQELGWLPDAPARSAIKPR